MSTQEKSTPKLLPSEFELDHLKSAGNAHSGHNVVFGRLKGFDVAVKPFEGADGRTLESRRNKAEHEMRMYKLLQELGYLTLKPKEVIDEHGIAYLITFYTPNLITGTSFDLTRPLEDTTRGKSNLDVVTEIMSETGKLHSDEITHGDSKLRNYAFHRKSGAGPYIIDLEGAQKHKSKSPGGYEFFNNAARNDIRSIMYNMGQNGLGARMSTSDQQDIFDDLLIAPYVSNLGDSLKLEKSTIENAHLSYTNGVQKFIDNGIRTRA
jgi:hypothetical protein